jgi:hypothetical protein
VEQARSERAVGAPPCSLQAATRCAGRRSEGVLQK